MPSRARIELRNRLLERQRQIAKSRPNQFAAGQVVKHLARSQRPGVPVKSAAVFYDKRNSRFGNALANAFEKRGISTQARGLLGNEASSPAHLRDLKNAARAEAVVMVAKDNNGAFAKTAHTVGKVAESRAGMRKGTRLAMMWGITPSAVREVLAVDSTVSRKMRVFTKKTLQAVKGCRKVQVTARNGTSITFELSPRIRWVQDNGVITRSYWGNMPAGEVFTSPLTANGKVVIDGSVERLGKVGKNPITVEIRNGRAVFESVKCKNEAVRRKFIRLLQTDRNSSRIGELGLGTNFAVKQLTGRILVDEKIPGVHIAFGDPYRHDTGARWESKGHYDGIMQKPTIIVDGRPIMLDGKSLL